MPGFSGLVPGSSGSVTIRLTVTMTSWSPLAVAVYHCGFVHQFPARRSNRVDCDGLTNGDRLTTVNWFSRHLLTIRIDINDPPGLLVSDRVCAGQFTINTGIRVPVDPGSVLVVNHLRELIRNNTGNIIILWDFRQSVVQRLFITVNKGLLLLPQGLLVASFHKGHQIGGMPLSTMSVALLVHLQ